MFGFWRIPVTNWSIFDLDPWFKVTPWSRGPPGLFMPDFSFSGRLQPDLSSVNSSTFFRFSHRFFTRAALNMFYDFIF